MNPHAHHYMYSLLPERALASFGAVRQEAV
jgi:hypothetical protein